MKCKFFRSKVKKMSATALVGVMLIGQGRLVAMPMTEIQVQESMMQQVVGNTYYVDATLGEDTNNGLTPRTPWKSLNKLNEIVFEPGDQILFKSGEMWNGSFEPKGSGTADAPIIVNSYVYEEGEVRINKGEKPILNGAGEVTNTIWLNNVEFWELHNLEVTNQGAERTKGRRGIFVSADEQFDQEENHYVEHIYMEDLYVHDVNGDLDDKGDGGILYDILSADMENPIAFKDILIEDCYVKEVSRSGIGVGGTKCAGLYPDLTVWPDEKLREVMHHEVVIRNNYVERAGGDAIVPKYCYEPLVEYNVSQEASVNTINEPNRMYNAAIWPWECYKPVFQYNEAFDTYLNGDGQAYDCDWSWGTLYQYNYSHDNEGGFMLVCLENTVDSVIRYNISQNDQRSLFMTSNKKPAYVYNNTFYIKEGLNTKVFSNHFAPLEFTNNIFYREGEPVNENWHEKQVKYDNNLYYGYNNVPAKDENAIIADPMFKDPGKGGQGTVENGPALESLHGYELQEGSPAINAGIYVGQDKLPAMMAPTTLDFYGNETGTFTVDLGAIDTMTSDIRPISDVYKINHQTKVVEDVKFGTIVGDLVASLRVESGVEITILKEGQAVTEGAVEEGMQIRTVRGTEEAVYTVGPLFGANDTVAPVISGVKDVMIKVGEDFDDMAGVTAQDDVDGDVTARIEVIGTVNTQVAGTYVITYKVQDVKGNIATAERTVVVIPIEGAVALYESFSGMDQGPVWFYEHRTGGVVGQMNKTKEDGTGYWKHPSPNNWALISKDTTNERIAIGASGSSEGMATFVAPKEGVVNVYDEVALQFPEMGGVVKYHIELNGQVVYPTTGEWVNLEGYNKEMVTNLVLEVKEGDRISFVSKYAGHSKPSLRTIPTVAYEAPKAPALEVVGANEVKAGETFELILVLKNVKDVYAQDLMITFDSNLFEIGEIKGLANTQVLEQKVTTSGAINVLAATPGGANGDVQLITVPLIAKQVEGTVAGEVSITRPTLGIVVADVSDIIMLEDVKHAISVQGETKPGFEEDTNQDGQVDIADLALIAYYYRATETSTNWEQAKVADVDNSGEVNATDLAKVANKILDK